MGSYLGDLATDVYGITSANSTIQPLTPRMRFNFTAILNFTDANGVGGGLVMKRIQSVSMPGTQKRQQVVNQYNKKRIIHTGVDYSPVSLVAYDDRSGQIESLIKSYNKYYFHNVSNLDVPSDVDIYADDIISDTFSGTRGSSEAGFKLRSNRNFLKSLVIMRKNSAEDANLIILKNPFISSIEGDTLNYGDSNPVQYTFNFAYEGFEILTGSPAEDQFQQAISVLDEQV
jgi:hypothetical protein